MSTEKDTPPVDNPPSPEDTAAEEIETDVNDDASIASAPAQKEVEPRKGGGRMLGGIALILSLLALGVGAYLWYRVEVEQRVEQTRTAANIDTNINRLTQQFTSLEKQQERLESRQTEIDKNVERALQRTIEPVQKSLADFDASQAEIETSIQELSSAVEKVYADLDRSLDSWALEEVEQLLRIANHSVNLAKDADTALEALRFADRRLRDLGNPKFTEVRRLVAEEMIQLEGVDAPDVTGLALRLSSLSSAIDEFPMKIPAQREIDGKPGSEGQKSENKWIKAGREMMADLQQLVRIQNIEEPAKPLMAPEQRFFLFENLRLALSSAQLALLKADTTVYRSNLEHVSGWLGTYFDVEDAQVSKTLSELEKMRKLELRPQLPDISSSLNALKKLKTRVESE